MSYHKAVLFNSINRNSTLLILLQDLDLDYYQERFSLLVTRFDYDEIEGHCTDCTDLCRGYVNGAQIEKALTQLEHRVGLSDVRWFFRDAPSYDLFKRG
jgi:hypothetical protein